MKFRNALLFVLLLSISFIYGSKNRIEDIEYFKNELKARHFNLFAHITEDRLNKELEKLKTIVNDLSDLEFALELQKIVTLCGDLHTNVNTSRLFNRGYIYPFRAHWLKGGCYIIGIHKEFEDVLGMKLEAINGINMKRIFDRFAKIIVRDNESILKKSVPRSIASKQILDFLNITKSDKNVFEFIDDAGNKHVKELKLINQVENPRNFSYLKPKSFNFTHKHRKKMFWSEKLDNKTFFIQYNMCSGKEHLKMIGKEKQAENTPSFNEFAENVVDQLQTENIEKLIFDMRYNPGGSSPQGTKLIKEISKLNNLKQIYVIIGRRTFSSAILNTIDFKKMTNAVLIGEETSGSPNHFGEVKNFKLPNSRLMVSYSTKYFKRVDSDQKSIKPDVIIDFTIEDYISGEDPFINYALEQ